MPSGAVRDAGASGRGPATSLRRVASPPGGSRALVSAGEGYSEIRERYDGVLIPEAWEQDLLETRQHLSTHGRRWLRPLSGDYRRARDRLSGLCREAPPEDVEQQLALVDAVLDARRNLEVDPGLRGAGGGPVRRKWQGERSDWAGLARLLEWVVDLYGKVGEGQLPEGLIGFFAEGRAREGLEAKVATIEGALVEQGSSVGEVSRQVELPDDVGASLMEQTLVAQESTFDAWHRNLERLQPLAAYNRLAETCRGEGLEGVLRQAETWPEAGSRLVDAFRRTWFEGLVERAFRERPALASFDRDNHEYVAQKFCELDRLALRAQPDPPGARPLARGPDARGRRAAWASSGERSRKRGATSRSAN